MKPLPQLESDTKELIKDIKKKQSFFYACFFIFRSALFKRIIEILNRWLFEAECLKGELESCHDKIEELKTDEKPLVPRKSENMKKGDLKIEEYADKKTFYSQKKIVDNIIRKLWDWKVSSIKNTEELTNLDVRELTELLK